MPINACFDDLVLINKVKNRKHLYRIDFDVNV